MSATTVNESSATEQAQGSKIFVHGAGKRLNTNVFFDRAEAERFGEPAEVRVVGEIQEGYRSQRDEDGFDLYSYMQMVELAEMAVILREGSRALGAELDLALDLSDRHSAYISIFGGEAELWQRIEELLPGSGSQITFLLRDGNLYKPDFDILADLVCEAAALLRVQAARPLYLIDRSADGWSAVLIEREAVANALQSAFPVFPVRFLGELPLHEALMERETIQAAEGVMGILKLAEFLKAPLEVLFDLRDGSRPTLELVGDSSDFIIALEDRILDSGSLEPAVDWSYEKLSGLFDLLTAQQEIGYAGVSYGVLSYWTLLGFAPTQRGFQR